MSVRETIDEALKTAQKAREAERVSALRLMRAAIQANDIAGRGGSAFYLLLSVRSCALIDQQGHSNQIDCLSH
jgi:hypothetical protein